MHRPSLIWLHRVSLALLELHSLRKNPIFTVINLFVPYQSLFFTVNLPSHVGGLLREPKIFPRLFWRAYTNLHTYSIQIYWSTVITSMPALKNPLFTAHFSEGPSPTGRKCQVLNCKYCKWTGTNTRRALKHLNNCATYTLISKANEPPAKRQATLQLGVQTILRAKKQKA